MVDGRRLGALFSYPFPGFSLRLKIRIRPPPFLLPPQDKAPPSYCWLSVTADLEQVADHVESDDTVGAPHPSQVIGLDAALHLEVVNEHRGHAWGGTIDAASVMGGKGTLD